MSNDLRVTIIDGKTLYETRVEHGPWRATHADHDRVHEDLRHRRYDGTMKNYEVAAAWVENALAYAQGGDLKTVIDNLEMIDKLLDKPWEDNHQYGWDDFK